MPRIVAVRDEFIAASQASSSGWLGGCPSQSCTGSTKPTPMSRCHRRVDDHPPQNRVFLRAR